MTAIVLAISISIAANLDNLGVGIAYGIEKIKISHGANFVIAFISFAATWLSARAGAAIGVYLRPEMARGIGAGLLMAIGLWVLVQPIASAIRSRKPVVDLQVLGTKIYIGPSEIIAHPERADIDKSRDTSFWEAILLGIALSINAMAGGFDAGIVGISATVESVMVGIVSFITILGGHKIGRSYGAVHLGRFATLISGTLLMLIGVHQFFG